MLKKSIQSQISSQLAHVNENQSLPENKKPTMERIKMVHGTNEHCFLIEWPKLSQTVTIN